MFCIKMILTFELTKRNKELYLECIKLKEEIGNENIQCEKILLENIKKNLNNEAVDPKNKRINEEDEDLNKNEIVTSESNQYQDKDSFNIEDYVQRIEKFIEGEINHLNKFKIFIGDFKDKSKKYMALNKSRNNFQSRNSLNTGSYQQTEYSQPKKIEKQSRDIENLNMINKLRGSLKNKSINENINETYENDETKKQIKFKQMRNNQSNRDYDGDSLENFSKLKEKFNLAQEFQKEEAFSKSTENANDKKTDSSFNLDSVQALISQLKNNNKIKKKEEPQAILNSEKNHESIKDPKIELLSKLKSLTLNLNTGNQEATNNLFKKFLDESANKAKNTVGSKNDEENHQGEKDKISKKQTIKPKEEIKKTKSIEDFDINDISESLAKLKNEKRKGNIDDNAVDQLEDNNTKDREKKNQSNNMDLSDNLNLDSFKNLLKKVDKKTKNDEQAIKKKENESANNSAENDNSSKLKAQKSEITEEKKPNKKTDFNFSLGKIESQIEMLKNLSINP